MRRELYLIVSWSKYNSKGSTISQHVFFNCVPFSYFHHQLLVSILTLCDAKAFFEFSLRLFQINISFVFQSKFSLFIFYNHVPCLRDFMRRKLFLVLKVNFIGFLYLLHDLWPHFLRSQEWKILCCLGRFISWAHVFHFH